MSIDLLVDAVLRVCAQLGVSRAHFAGHSLGTIVCQHLAVRAPERVRSLALFGTLLAPPDPARQGLKTRAAKARDEGMFGIADAIVQGCAYRAPRANSCRLSWLSYANRCWHRIPKVMRERAKHSPPQILRRSKASTLRRCWSQATRMQSHPWRLRAI